MKKILVEILLLFSFLALRAWFNYPINPEVLQPGEEKVVDSLKFYYEDVPAQHLVDTVVSIIHKYLPYSSFIEVDAPLYDSLNVGELELVDIYVVYSYYYPLRDDKDSISIEPLNFICFNLAKGIECHYNMENSQIWMLRGYNGMMYNSISGLIKNSSKRVRHKKGRVLCVFRAVIKDGKLFCLEVMYGY